MEDSDASDEGREVELPQVARNLSPRLVVVRESNLTNTLMGLNIDSLDGNEKSVRKAKGKGLRARFQSDRQFRSSTSINSSFQVLRDD